MPDAIHDLLALVVDESKWLPVSMGCALLAAAAMLYRRRGADVPGRRRVLAAMNLFFGVTIGVMALGHLSAVSAKLYLGTLEGRAGILYPIGVALVVPAAWVIWHTRRVLAGPGRATLVLNLWLVATLLALGIHNLPLAVQGILNAGYQLHSNRTVGRAIVALAIAVNLSLFVGSVIFLASGQTFEEFRGVE